MLKNKLHLKNKMHILLVISFISVAMISFFFMANTAFAGSGKTTGWGVGEHDGDLTPEKGVTADEPKNKYRIGIDDIVYNRVPLFDVNVFSATPGGQPLDEKSPVYFLRTLCAHWFVLGMNLSLAAMIIIIIYTGIRMALTTIAEKKAEYKEMLFNLVKAIAKIFMLAAIMALIIMISQYVTSIFADHGPNPDDPISGKNLYVTMVTRALGSFSFKAKIPAAILFFGLTLTFFKFCFRYTKRLLNTYLLIIIAPILVAKDAYEGASGKQGKTFSAWLQEFTLNVALQPAHALIYTSLVYVALKNGTNDILSFFVAVLIMNFMVSADKIFFKIFNMRFTKGPGAAGAADALTEGVKMYAGIQAAKEAASLSAKAVVGTGKFARNTGRVIGGTTKSIANKIGSIDSEANNRRKETRSQKKQQKERENRLGEEPTGLAALTAPFVNASKSLQESADRHAKNRNQKKRERNAEKAYKDIQSMQDFEKGIGASKVMPAALRNYISGAKTDKAIKDLGKARSRKDDDKSFLSQMNELRKLAKRKDETGRITRKLLKMKREHEIKKFKYVAGSIVGVAAQGISILAAPALIAADESDIALAGVTATMGNTSSAIAKHYYYRRNAKDEYFTKRSFEDTIESLKNADENLGVLQAKFDAIEAGDRESRKETYIQMAAYSELKLDEHTIRSMVNAYLLKKSITTFDESVISEVIDQVLADSGVKDLGIKAEEIKRALVAEMLNSQVNHRVEAHFADALNAGSEEDTGRKKIFTESEVIDIAKQAVKGEDLSELTDNQIERIVDVAMAKANITGQKPIFQKAKDEVFAIANEQREKKFADEVQKLIDEKATVEKIETAAEKMIEALAVEKIEDKDTYVDIVLDKLDLTGSLSEEQRQQIEKSVGEKVARAIEKNNETRHIDRVDTNAAASSVAENEKKLVDQGLAELGADDVLSEDVRKAIDEIKKNVKHEKTKRGSIGTITDLDRRLRHMRDVL